MTGVNLAELQALLEGVPLPAGKAELLAYAGQERADSAQIAALERLPEREFASLDDVAEALDGVQPALPGLPPPPPHTESGSPPGETEYTA